MFNVQPELGFNVSPAVTPGFRVGLPEDRTASSIDTIEPMSRAGSSNATAYAFNPYIFDLGVATSPLAPPSRVSVDDDYYPKIIANCRSQCSARYETLGGELGFPWMRVCIRNCVAPSGCSY